MFSDQPLQITYVSPEASQRFPAVAFAQLTHAGGDTYSGTLLLPRYSPDCTRTPRSLDVSDLAGNARSYTQDALAAFGAGAAFQVTG